MGKEENAYVKLYFYLHNIPHYYCYFSAFVHVLYLILLRATSVSAVINEIRSISYSTSQ